MSPSARPVLERLMALFNRPALPKRTHPERAAVDIRLSRLERRVDRLDARVAAVDARIDALHHQ